MDGNVYSLLLFGTNVGTARKDLYLRIYMYMYIYKYCSCILDILLLGFYEG